MRDPETRGSRFALLYPDALFARLNIFRMRNTRRSRFKVIATTGENPAGGTRPPGDARLASFGKRSRKIATWYVLAAAADDDFYYVRYVACSSGLALIPTRSVDSGLFRGPVDPRAKPIYSCRNQRALLTARIDIFALSDACRPERDLTQPFATKVAQKASIFFTLPPSRPFISPCITYLPLNYPKNVTAHTDNLRSARFFKLWRRAIDIYATEILSLITSLKKNGRFR